jgi:hypothetical protein
VNAPVAGTPKALPLKLLTGGTVGAPTSVGESADRAIAEKADAEALHAKSVTTPKTPAKAVAELHPATKVNPHAHAHATPAKAASRQQHAGAPVATGPSAPATGGRSAPGASGQ